MGGKICRRGFGNRFIFPAPDANKKNGQPEEGCPFFLLRSAAGGNYASLPMIASETSLMEGRPSTEITLVPPPRPLK